MLPITSIRSSSHTWGGILLLLLLLLLLLIRRSTTSVSSLGGLLENISSPFSCGGILLSCGGIILLPPIRWSVLVFGSLGVLLKQRLPTASMKDSLSSKDNFIETRTKIIVGAIPYPGNCYQWNKKSWKINRFYNHNNHLVDTNGQVNSVRQLHWQVGKHDANQLNGKQRHTGFNYYEYGMPKCGTPGWAQSSLDRSQEHFKVDDFEHDQARHQGIYGHGRDETCQSHWVLPGSIYITALFKCCWASWR